MVSMDDFQSFDGGSIPPERIAFINLFINKTNKTANVAPRPL